MDLLNAVESACANCTETALADQLRIASKAALTAGMLIRDLYEQPVTIAKKGAIDLVTEADLAAEAAILSILAEESPGVAILSEESAGGDARPAAEPVWIVDPLDGTTNFAHGFPYFGVSIALVSGNRPLVGVVYVPMQQELFCASSQGGAWLGDRRLQVSATEFLINSLVGTGFPYDIEDNLAMLMADLEAVLPRVRDIRRAGAAAVDLAYVACGRLDAFYETGLKPWDTAAGMLLIEEAKGNASTFSGSACSPYSGEILASNGILHAAMLDLLG